MLIWDWSKVKLNWYWKLDLKLFFSHSYFSAKIFACKHKLKTLNWNSKSGPQFYWPALELRARTKNLCFTATTLWFQKHFLYHTVLCSIFAAVLLKRNRRLEKTLRAGNLIKSILIFSSVMRHSDSGPEWLWNSAVFCFIVSLWTKRSLWPVCADSISKMESNGKRYAKRKWSHCTCLMSLVTDVNRWLANLMQHMNREESYFFWTS